MTDPSDQPGGGRDLDELAGHAERLTVAIEAAIAGWAERSVLRVADAWRPGRSGELAAEAAQAGREALEDVGPRVRRLLESDVEAQATGPLEICRSAVRHPTRVLAEAGVPPVVRDEVAERMFPDDPYDLTPGTFADVDPAVVEPGLTWGAAKAHVVMARRRAEGRR